jgi:hypothetical protein
MRYRRHEDTDEAAIAGLLPLDSLRFEYNIEPHPYRGEPYLAHLSLNDVPATPQPDKAEPMSTLTQLSCMGAIVSGEPSGNFRGADKRRFVDFFFLKEIKERRINFAFCSLLSQIP